MNKAIHRKTRLSIRQAYIWIQICLIFLSGLVMNAAAEPEVPLKYNPVIWGPLAAVGYQVAAASPLPSQQFGSRFITFDVDKDGDQDLFYQNGATSGAGISLKLNNGDGTYGTAINAVSGTFSSGPFSGITFTQVSNGTLFPIDYDNDGDLDLFEPVNNSPGRVLVNNNGTSFSIAASSPLPSQTFGSRFITFDIDKDGDQDLFYQNGATSGAGISLKLNNGDGLMALLLMLSRVLFPVGLLVVLLLPRFLTGHCFLLITTMMEILIYLNPPTILRGVFWLIIMEQVLVSPLQVLCRPSNSAAVLSILMWMLMAIRICFIKTVLQVAQE